MTLSSTRRARLRGVCASRLGAVLTLEARSRLGPKIDAHVCAPCLFALLVWAPRPFWSPRARLGFKMALSSARRACLCFSPKRRGYSGAGGPVWVPKQLFRLRAVPVCASRLGAVPILEPAGPSGFQTDPLVYARCLLWFLV